MSSTGKMTEEQYKRFMAEKVNRKQAALAREVGDEKTAKVHDAQAAKYHEQNSDIRVLEAVNQSGATDSASRAKLSSVLQKLEGNEMYKFIKGDFAQMRENTNKVNYNTKKVIDNSYTIEANNDAAKANKPLVDNIKGRIGVKKFVSLLPVEEKENKSPVDALLAEAKKLDDANQQYVKLLAAFNEANNIVVAKEDGTICDLVDALFPGTDFHVQKNMEAPFDVKDPGKDIEKYMKELGAYIENNPAI